MKHLIPIRLSTSLTRQATGNYFSIPHIKKIGKNGAIKLFSTASKYSKQSKAECYMKETTAEIQREWIFLD